MVAGLAAEMRARPDTPWAVVGIRRGGVELASRLAAGVVAAGLPAPARGDIDITLYRDDLYTGLEKPELGGSDLRFEVTDASILLVDDVLFTGRTVRAALREIHDFGRPARVRLAALVDRGHRELPIGGDYVGVTIQTGLRDRVVVELAPGGPSPSDGAWLEERP